MNYQPYQKLKGWVKNNFPRLYVITKNVHMSIKFPRFYIHREILKDSIFVYENELNMASLFPKKIIDKTLEVFHPKSVLDLGCGTGKALDYFFSRGIDVVGVEGSKIAISHANNRKMIIRKNLNYELNLFRKFDLIWSFEFVEHIHPRYLNNLLRSFSNHSDRIILSAAAPGQGGDGHFNERLPQYWIEKFGRYGYEYNEVITEELRKIDEIYHKNMLVFER